VSTRLWVGRRVGMLGWSGFWLKLLGLMCAIAPRGIWLRFSRKLKKGKKTVVMQ